jgi:hypothetical protein
MAAAGHYSQLNSSPSKPQSFSSEFSCRREDIMVVPGAWPMSSQIQCQNPIGHSGTVVRRNASSTGISRQKSPRPMSMPSHHLHVHANALATLNSYCLDSDEISPVPSSYVSPSPVPLRVQGTPEAIVTPTPSCVPWISNVKAIKKIQSKIGMGM